LTSPWSSCYLLRHQKTFGYLGQNFYLGFALGRIIVGIILVILGATFCALNRQEISLRYFLGWNTSHFPLFLLILGSLGGGMIVGFLVGWGGRRKLRAEMHDLEKQAQALREEIATLMPKEEGPEIPSKGAEVNNPPFS
jgi:uncharacterized integral membrane protein